MRTTTLFALMTVLVLACSQAPAQAPTATGPSQGYGLSQGTAAIQLRATNGQPRNAAEYYGWPTAAQGPAAAPTTTVAPLATRPIAGPAGKPFTHINESPTLSPYLNLYREQTDDSIPNYYAFVRPQQEQIALNREQARELSKLRQRVQQVQYAAPAAAGAGGRFNNTGRFYQGWNR